MAIIDPNDEFIAHFFQRVDPRVAQSFSAEQVAAIKRAFQPSRHPINIRGQVPLTGGRFFFVLLVGRERRAPVRIAAERARNPLFTRSNIIVFTMFALLSLLALVGAASVFLKP